MYWNDNTSFTINKGAPWLLDTGSTYYWQVWTCTTAIRNPPGCLEANGRNMVGPLKQVLLHSPRMAQGRLDLEIQHGSGVGSSLNAASITFQLAMTYTNRQYRAILSSIPLPLPDNAIIQSAALKIAQTGSAVPVPSLYPSWAPCMWNP